MDYRRRYNAKQATIWPTLREIRCSISEKKIYFWKVMQSVSKKVIFPLQTVFTIDLKLKKIPGNVTSNKKENTNNRRFIKK